MDKPSDFRKHTDVFAALVVSVGCMLVGEESDQMLADLTACPQADLGPGLLAAALTYLRAEPENLRRMAEAALKTSIAVLYSNFRPTD